MLFRVDSRTGYFVWAYKNLKALAQGHSPFALATSDLRVIPGKNVDPNQFAACLRKYQLTCRECQQQHQSIHFPSLVVSIYIKFSSELVCSEQI